MRWLQRQLSRVLFPLGPLTKPVVRQLAAAAQLPNQARKDSQGICFLGKVCNERPPPFPAPQFRLLGPNRAMPWHLEYQPAK